MGPSVVDLLCGLLMMDSKPFSALQMITSFCVQEKIQSIFRRFIAALPSPNVMVSRHRILCTVYNHSARTDDAFPCRAGMLRSLTLPNKQIMQGMLCVQGPARIPHRDSSTVNAWPDMIGIRESDQLLRAWPLSRNGDLTL